MNHELKPPFGVLYVDDGIKSLRYFKESFEDEFVIHTASNAWDGYQILVEHGAQIGVLITDQRMPGENGVELMERARQLNPNLVRILITAYAEYQTAVDAVNAGHAFRYLHKPWNPQEICSAVSHGLRYYEAMVEREVLLAEKAQNFRQMVMADRVNGMGILAEGLNHHLRNAMTVIRAFIDLAPMKLAEETGGREPRDKTFWHEWQPQAINQMDRIQHMLERLSSASHAKQLVRGDLVDLADVLSEALNRYSEALMDQGINVGIELSDNLPTLMVNEEKFQQLWHLIFTQALTDLERGHDLEIFTALEPHPDGDQVVMRIRDNAAWPEQENPSNLFDPFFVRSDQPNEYGVNMMACYVIVHLHGGTIEAKALEPKGMELEIRIPVEPSTQPDCSTDFFERLLRHQERWRYRESTLPADVDPAAFPLNA